MKTFLVLALFSLAATCSQKSGLTTFENAEGKIKVFVCTRGCYQYLLEHNGVYYFPDQLPDELKVDGKAVIFTGELQSDSTMVKKPAPNDVPVDDFKARNIKILSIEEG
jgi:hypothetical protein